MSLTLVLLGYVGVNHAKYKANRSARGLELRLGNLLAILEDGPLLREAYSSIRVFPVCPYPHAATSRALVSKVVQALSVNGKPSQDRTDRLHYNVA